ncbi:MAG: sigma-54-dependent Fis family transcriptional regulator [Planctomycetaceae bacterium]|nr:sigma-54-dependent Fis family transcriptional regulator [Planctomycetaceae bacterium]
MPTRSPDPSSQSADKLLAVLSITQKLNAERDLAALLTTIAREAARLLDAELASLFLLDAQRGELWSKVTLDTDETLRFDARQGIAGEALRTGQIVRVDDVSRDHRFFSGVDQRTGHTTHSVMALPLRNLRGEDVGVFEVLNKRRGAFTDEDVELARLLASQMTIALETTQLLGDLRRDHDALLANSAHLWKEVEGRFATDRILGTSAKIAEVVRLIGQVADSSASVLITGESGTGKELAAKAIHYNSPRARRPLVALNCAALPEALVESELFGIEKGVATGVESRVGKFEAAHQATLLLDEIGDLSLTAQSKLLRVLQERVLERVGGRRAIPVDVRVLAATNKNLAAAVRAGAFREDLFYRLNVVQLHMPPLREIREDIPLLAKSYLAQHCAEQNRPPPEFSAGALACLTNYRWPGNVRELGNEMKRLAVTVPRDRIDAADLSDLIRAGDLQQPPQTGPRLKDAVAQLERRMIETALAQCRHNQQQAARALGLSRQGLIKKLKRYGVANRPE